MSAAFVECELKPCEVSSSDVRRVATIILHFRQMSLHVRACVCVCVCACVCVCLRAIAFAHVSE